MREYDFASIRVTKCCDRATCSRRYAYRVLYLPQSVTDQVRSGKTNAVILNLWTIEAVRQYTRFWEEGVANESSGEMGGKRVACGAPSRACTSFKKRHRPDIAATLACPTIHSPGRRAVAPKSGLSWQRQSHQKVLATSSSSELRRYPFGLLFLRKSLESNSSVLSFCKMPAVSVLRDL